MGGMLAGAAGTLTCFAVQSTCTMFLNQRNTTQQAGPSRTYFANVDIAALFIDLRVVQGEDGVVDASDVGNPGAFVVCFYDIG